MSDANRCYKGCTKYLTLKGNTHSAANKILKRYSKEELDYHTADLLAIATKVQTNFSNFVNWYKTNYGK